MPSKSTFWGRIEERVLLALVVAIECAEATIDHVKRGWELGRRC